MDAVNRKIIFKPRLKWRCPPRIDLSHDWCVAAGEESEEAKSQKHRERKIPEILYIRRSYIPSNPSFPRNVKEEEDESQIPLIRMTPIEEAESPEENDSSLGGTKVLLPSSPPPASKREAQSQIKTSTISLPAVEAGSSTQADVALAAATAVTALLKSNESGSCIDTDLLVKIFSDPKRVKKLLNEVGAHSSGKTKPVLEKNLSEASMALPKSKPVSVEKVYTEHGSLKKSVDTSCPNSSTEPRKYTDENGAAGNKRKASFSNSGQMKCELALSIKEVTPVPRPNSLSSQFTFISQRDMLVQKSTSLPVMPTGTPVPFLPTSKPDLDEFKWTDNGYGVPTNTSIEPIIRKYLLSPEATIPTPNEGLLLPSRMNIHPLPIARPTDIKLKAVLSDAVRPTHSQLMSAPPGASRVNPYLFPNQAQSALQMKAPLLHLGQPSFELTQRFQNPLQSGAQMMALAAVNAQPRPFLHKAGPQVLDNNYLKALVKKHGEVQQDRDNSSLRFHQQNIKPEPYLDPNEMKIQRPCFFFNSPEGCRLGYGCPYLHVQPQNMQPGSVMGTHSSKRVKLDGQFSGYIGKNFG